MYAAASHILFAIFTDQAYSQLFPSFPFLVTFRLAVQSREDTAIFIGNHLLRSRKLNLTRKYTNIGRNAIISEMLSILTPEIFHCPVFRAAVGITRLTAPFRQSLRLARHVKL